MNLLVDLGNSRIKWANSGPQHWETGAETIPDEGFSALLERLWGQTAAPERVVVSSVHGPQRERLLHDWLMRRWAIEPQFIRAQAQQLGVTNRYHDPSALGADRWAALLAARRASSAAQCVVDCGTAVTIDALSADGEFLGGVILSGLHMMRAGLLADTHGIRNGDGAEDNCLARNTGDGVAAGSLFGLAGAIERVVAEQRRTHGVNAHVVLTGGDAPRLLPLLSGPVAHVPDLVLQGLKLIAEAGA
jgi:type III pantothenate kinase